MSSRRLGIDAILTRTAIGSTRFGEPRYWNGKRRARFVSICWRRTIITMLRLSDRFIKTDVPTVGICVCRKAICRSRNPLQ